MAFIVFNHVGSHLQRRVKYHPIGYLLGKRGIDTAVLTVFHIPLFPVGIVFGTLVQHIKDTRRIVHRTTQQTGKRQHHMMFRRITFAPGIPLHAAGAFAGHHVGIGTTYTGILYRLMHIEGSTILGSRFHDIAIMPHIELSVVVVTVGKTTGIPGLYAMDTQIGIPFISLIQLIFVITDISSRFMMTDNLNTLLPGISCYFLYIEIGIRFGIIEVLRSAPVLPTFIPAFEHNGFDVVGCGKINITFCIFGSGAVAVVYHPALHTQMHAPPYTYILHRANPVGRLQNAGFV